MVHHPDLHQVATIERGLAFDPFRLDLRYCLKDVLQTVPELSIVTPPLVGRAPAAALSGRPPSPGPPGNPVTPANPPSSPPKSNNEHPARGVTSRSTSLAPLLSPRATEPNTRTFPVRGRLGLVLDSLPPLPGRAHGHPSALSYRMSPPGGRGFVGSLSCKQPFAPFAM